jgi:hypothetical protein
LEPKVAISSYPIKTTCHIMIADFLLVKSHFVT